MKAEINRMFKVKSNNAKKAQEMSVMFRVPDHLREPFFKTADSNNLSGQQLLEQMVEFCLENKG